MTTPTATDTALPWEEQPQAVPPVAAAAPDSCSFDPLYMQMAELANLRAAWQQIRSKGKSGGIDGETIHSLPIPPRRNWQN